MNNKLEISLASQLERLFIKKEVDMKQNHIIAAIITSAEKMAPLAEYDGNKVINELMDFYQKNDDAAIQELLGMNSQTVKSNIGFSTDFNDYSRAQSGYDAQKVEYDSLYQTIELRNQNKGNIQEEENNRSI